MTPIAAALVLLAGGILAYLQGSGPTAVSAQTILSRGATAGLVPGHAAHFTYTLTTSGGYTGRESIWIAVNQQRGVRRLALRVTMLKGGIPVPALDVQFVESGNVAQSYSPATNTVTIAPGRREPAWTTVITGTSIARKLQIGASSPTRGAKGLLQKVHLLPSRTLAGHRVYALQLSPAETLYFDAHTYVLRGADWSQDGQRWKARLVQLHTLATDRVPPGTFDLRVPPTAQVTKIRP